MVKGVSRRVVVVESPDQRFFEQAIFILRSDAAGEGVSSREWWRRPGEWPGTTPPAAAASAGSGIFRRWCGR